MEDHESVSANGKNIEDIRIKPDLEDVSEDDFEEAYDLLKKSIDRKRQTQRKEFNGSMCKICGKKLTSNAQLQECKLCNISTCKNCRSCGFCLNCFVHMKEDYRKTLKLTRI